MTNYLDKCLIKTNFGFSRLKASRDLSVFILNDNEYLAYTHRDLNCLLQNPRNCFLEGTKLEKTCYYLPYDSKGIFVDSSLVDSFHSYGNTFRLEKSKQKFINKIKNESFNFYFVKRVSREDIGSNELSELSIADDDYGEYKISWTPKAPIELLIFSDYQKQIETIKNLEKMWLKQKTEMENYQESLYCDEEYCMNAVKRNGLNLQFVKNQTLEICITAIENNPMAIQFVKNQTDMIAEIAFEKNHQVFQFILNKTPALCLEAVKKDGSLIAYIENKTPEICDIALGNSIYAIKYLNKTGDFCMKAVSHDGYALEYIENQTEEMCLKAIQTRPMSLKFVKNKTEAICIEAVKRYGETLQFVENQTPEICSEAVKQHGWNLRYVKNQTEALCLEAVKRHGYALEYVKEENQTDEICFEAIKDNRYCIKYIKSIQSDFYDKYVKYENYNDNDD